MKVNQYFETNEKILFEVKRKLRFSILVITVISFWTIIDIYLLIPYYKIVFKNYLSFQSLFDYRTVIVVFGLFLTFGINFVTIQRSIF